MSSEQETEEDTEIISNLETLCSVENGYSIRKATSKPAALKFVPTFGTSDFRALPHGISLGWLVQILLSREHICLVVAYSLIKLLKEQLKYTFAAVWFEQKSVFGCEAGGVEGMIRQPRCLALVPQGWMVSSHVWCGSGGCCCRDEVSTGLGQPSCWGHLCLLHVRNGFNHEHSKHGFGVAFV